MVRAMDSHQREKAPVASENGGSREGRSSSADGRAGMKVGELAKRTGLTVRTLHHYDEIGLLRPGGRTASGHRLYGDAEVRRLQQIASLRHLGLPLDEIRDCLDRPEYALERVLDMQIDRIDEQIGRQARLRQLVAALRERVRSAESVSVDELTHTIEVTMTYEKYYSPEQIEQLRTRREEVGEARIRQVEKEWKDLFAAFEKAMDDGLAPESSEVALLARRSNALVAEFTGGDAGIQASLGKMMRSEGPQEVMGRHGMQMRPGLWEYMGRAKAALRGGS